MNIVAMVFANLNMASDTGVAFTRDPASGAQGIYEDYLQNAQGEDVAAETGVHLNSLTGTMIELRRAALTTEQIAESAEFFSFGTSDSTQATSCFSCDNVEAAFFSTYLDNGIFGVSPFESIDTEGVGELVRITAEKGRSRRPGLKLGICGERGGDPANVHFFERVGLDYVSCSPFGLPVARLEAGRAMKVVTES